jgi:cytoskeletal protein CcmA (bactofilin family)
MLPATEFMPESSKQLLYVGEGVTIKGDITVADTLIVCGLVDGNVSTGNLIVGETGVIKGRIVVAQNAEISGRVLNKLDVKSLMFLRATGRVDGSVSYGILQIEQGATIAGGISSADHRYEQKTARPDSSARPEQRAFRHESRLGNGAWTAKQPDRLNLEQEPIPTTPLAR